MGETKGDRDPVSVTVIITTYNRAEMVCEAIESVLQQTIIPEQIIVVDDGSTDHTKKRLAAYHHHISYVWQAHSGISVARNFGLQHSAGQFIAFLDSDDLWLKNKLEIQLETMRNNPDEMINFTDEIWLRAGRKVNQKLRHQKLSGWIFEPSLHLCLVSPSSALMRRKLFEIIGYFDETLPVCEDYDFWLRVAHRFPFQFIAQKLIIKRGGHSDQLSRKYWGMDRFRIQVLQKLLHLPDISALQKKHIKSVLQKKCRIVAHGCQVRGKKHEENFYRHLGQSVD
ncbi:glycosyltransferase family 2 protein [candidate division CSSED10-310 bacterium]|uniref:Glycosyltransferase family 2 protein n=1 Tax=candidate division CSSED10-310 bacterium TaxID=2855610 RepID=A0ABV6YW43_UNCC1